MKRTIRPKRLFVDDAKIAKVTADIEGMSLTTEDTQVFNSIISSNPYLFRWIAEVNPESIPVMSQVCGLWNKRLAEFRETIEKERYNDLKLLAAKGTMSSMQFFRIAGNKFYKRCLESLLPMHPHQWSTLAAHYASIGNLAGLEFIGTYVHYGDRRFQRAMEYAFDEQPKLECIKYLHRFMPLPPSAFYRACIHGHFDLARYIYENGPEVTNMYRAIRDTLRVGQMDVYNWLIEVHPLDEEEAARLVDDST